MLEVEDLLVGYGAATVLHGVSLRVGPGELVAVVGPNGSGKSTLLMTIQGLLAPVAGRIRLAGQEIHGQPAHALVERGIVYIPEGRHLFPDMSVQENLEVGAYVARARHRAPHTLRLVLDLFPPLRQKRSWPAAALSGGEQQMLAVARGLMGRPRLLLLDDPFLGLAPKIIARFCEVIQAIGDEGIAVLLVGQHVRRILRLARRGYLLELGRITAEDAGPALLDSPAVQRALFGA
jgi:branched-chain amino acid transport system ATP-binding protein